MTWPRQVPAASVRIPCDGELHTILWKRGALVLVDHDPVADAVLVALGGPAPACLELRRSWRIGFVEGQFTSASAGLVRSLSSLARWMGGSGPRPPRLPEPLRRLREASLLETWGRGLGDAGAARSAQQDLLEQAVVGRVRDIALGQLRTVTAPRADVQLEISVDHEGRRAALAAGTACASKAYVQIEVPSRWLTAVWAPGLETVDGCLVLDADNRPGGPVLAATWVPGDDETWNLDTVWI